MSDIIHNSPADIAELAARVLLDTQSVLLNPAEPFTLTSGRKSPVYVDCRRLMSFPEERSLLMDAAAKILEEKIGITDIDVLAGGETAGIPYAAFIAERLKKPMIYVRKKPKGFGRMAQIEGAIENENAKAVLIEDLQTDGGSKEVFVNALREAGAEISHAFVIFHYGIFQKSIDNMKDMGLNLYSLTTWHDVINVAKKEERLPPDQIAEVESFLDNPDDWQPAKSAQNS